LEEKSIFALDIGTRKITGLIMTPTGEGYDIRAARSIEHATRAMIDGQIHDIEAVAQTIKSVKQALEEELGIKLEQAAVAAAGRALQTCRGESVRERQHMGEMTADEVRAMEAEAVQHAQMTLAQSEAGVKDSGNYFCVGYSVIRYRLEDQEIGSLIGQTGHRAAVEVIATFLPRVVVDSLYSSLKRAGLSVYSLTLEPIAALSVAIPSSMRLLNLALVDIGAGTSDIAIVKAGNIFGYAMVPMGGDELTEALASQYLLDFNQAERIKRQLSTAERVSFDDILNNHLDLPAAEVKQSLVPLIKEIAAAIARHILELNQKSPAAVMCVGGGSLTPGLTAALAEALEMPAARVGIKTRESIAHITGEFDFLSGPQGVTPLGIAFNSINHPPLPLIKVSVNGQETALWNAGKTNLMQALLSSGITLTNIYGRPGLGKTIEVNGRLKIFKGQMGTAPVIRCNGAEASLETIIGEGDIITFAKGQDGSDAHVTAKDLVNWEAGFVYVNGEKIDLVPMVTVDGRALKADEPIPDRARVKIENHNQLTYILTQAGVGNHRLREEEYRYFLNDQEMITRWLPIRVTLNGEPARLTETVNPGSRIEYDLLAEQPTVKDIVNLSPLKINITVNDKPLTLAASRRTVIMNGQPAREDQTITQGAHLEIDHEQTGCILSDIFRTFDFKTSEAKTRLVLEVDGQPAGYTTPIGEGSCVRIFWE
jgi:cell division protein FtsA